MIKLSSFPPNAYSSLPGTSSLRGEPSSLMHSSNNARSSDQIVTTSRTTSIGTTPSTAPFLAGSERCLSDSISDRTLNGAFRNSATNTIAGCARFCQQQGYKWSGTEYGSECFCGDTISERAANSSRCNYRCSGSAEICGGDGAISIVQLDPGYETIPASAPLGYLGCFQNVSALEDGLFGSRFMTPGVCNKYCGDLGYPFAATAYGVNCYCGLSVPPNLKLANDCNQACRGDNAQICGGNGVMSMWKLSRSFVMPIFPQPLTSAGQGLAVDNIDPFQAISLEAPSSMFARLNHRIMPKGIEAGSSLPPVHTNKQYAQLFINSQTSAAFMEPYAFNYIGNAFAIQNADYPEEYTWDQDKVVPEYIGGQLNKHQLSFSSSECCDGSCYLNLSDSKHASVAVTLSTNIGVGSLSTHLVSGMGLVTTIYEDMRPNITSLPGISDATLLTGASSAFSEKWKLNLKDGSTWMIYVISSVPAPILSFANGSLTADFVCTGVIQTAKMPRNAEDDSLYDRFIGTWVTSISLSAQVQSTTASYTLNYQTAGQNNIEPLIFALPHHVASLVPSTKAAGISLHSGMHGLATGYSSRTLTMVENSLPSDIGFLLDDVRAVWSNTTLFAIKKAITPDILGADFMGCNTYSTYFSGKCLAKSAQLCLLARDVVQDDDLFQICLSQLKAVMDVFTSNTHNTFLNYDPIWKGVVADAGYAMPGADFGATDYNDHHFHYGYIIYASAILAHIDPTWMLTSGSQAFVETLIRDCANPSEEDIHFPQFRSMDWYVGHSLAHGVATDFADGKDEESSSEDYNLAYAIQLYGKATSNDELQALGTLMGAINARSIQSYMLLGPENEVQPAIYNMNYVSGILFANKMVHSTFFGGQTQFVHGIHMLPLTPMSPFVRKASFVANEWRDVLASLAGSLTDNWAGILHSNLAISDPAASWRFFANGNVNKFNYDFLDDGQTLTWALFFAASQGGGI